MPVVVDWLPVTDRLALLIGVPNCDSALFEPLENVVEADIERMSDALHASGFEVRYCDGHRAGSRMPSLNTIKLSILEALEAAPAGGTLLIYFSGHGITVDGSAYLIPQDPIVLNGQFFKDSLVPVSLPDLGRCRARLVMFVVDACRDDPARSSTVPRASLPVPVAGDFVLISSCSPGQVSAYSDSGSAFTKAFAEAIGPQHPARTVRKIFDTVVHRLAAIGPHEEDQRQKPQMIATAVHGSPDDLVVCESDQVSGRWRDAVRDTPIWRRVTDERARDQAKDLAVAVVESSAAIWLTAQGRFADAMGFTDPWAAPDHPIRVLACAEQCLQAEVSLKAIEAALLVAAPFIHEVAQSVGLERSVEVDPTNFTRTFEVTARYDLEITHHMYEHVCRRAEGLGKRGYTEYRDTLAMWLVHRWLAGRAAIWEEPAVKLACRQLAEAAYPLSGFAFTEDELSGLIVTLARCSGAEADDQALIERLQGHDFTVGTRVLAGALWLGGLMAADPRRVPSVIVDHLGVGSSLQMTDVHRLIAMTRWERVRDGLDLSGVCRHPALHDALVDVAERTDFARKESIAKLSGAEQLPVEFTHQGVRPATPNGVDAYQVPLLRFRLSEEKIRELLMGRQLYGEPELAIRELYQNALDACRYRTARRQYLERIGVRLSDWRGRIEFRQGTTHDGRKYVECMDNGVGMNRDTLEKTFANAGERFIYRSSFRREQSLWQDQDPPIRLVPNSQFGVGVFSYFMLAELIEITTRPLDEHDNAEPVGYQVRIASSGSLFQITETRDPSPGTRVRLYLTGDDDISVMRTMRYLLRVAEYDVVVDEDEVAVDRWEAEELYYPEAGVQYRKAGDDFWWVAGAGCLVADGIATSEERYGFMVNLRGRRQPQFTVDRKEVRAWDKDWVNQKIQEGLPQLMDWPGLTLPWLWEVAETTPSVANDIFQRLRAEGRSLAVEGAVGHGVTADIRRVGCFPLDKTIVGAGFHFFSNDWLTQWRLGVWKDYLQLPAWYRVAAPGDISGLPLVDPFDAQVLDATRSGHWYREWRRGRPGRENLLEMSSSDETAPAERLHRLRRYAIVGLDLTAARETPHVDRVLKEEELPLLPALAAWSPPGSLPRKVIGPCLASVSHAMHLPISTVIKRAARLAPPDWVQPAELPDELSKMTATGADVRMLVYYCPQPEDSGDSLVVSPEKLIQIMAAFDLTVTKAIQQIERYAYFGYVVEAREKYPSDLTKIEVEALRSKPCVGLKISAAELISLAGTCDLSLREAQEGLKRIAEVGLIAALDPYSVPLGIPTPLETQAAREIQSFGPNFMGRRWPHPSYAFAMVVAQVANVQDEDSDEDVRRRRRILDMVAEGHRATVVELLYIAFQNRCTVAEAFELLQKLFPDNGDLVGDLPEEVRSSDIPCRSWNDERILLGRDYGQDISSQGMEWHIWSSDVAKAALDLDRPLPVILDRLSRYRALGAPVPELSEEQRLAFADTPVTEHDVEMLTREDDLGYNKPVVSIDALYLVQVAGRFGWSVREADIRIRRYEFLGLTLSYDCAACPDRLVHWQDLLAVTVHLDGQQPVLRGPVSAAHFTAAAALLGETPRQVVERLLPYSALIGFTIDEECIVA